MKRDKIPLNWVEIVSALVIIAISAAILSWEEFRTENPFHALLAVILIAVMLWALWGLTERRELDAEGIHRLRFGREIKFLRWDQIQQLGILRQERQHRRGISQLFLVVIPKGVEPFAPNMESGCGYLSRNRRQILTEQIKYAPMFETYYGPLDFDVRNYSRR
ncbi:MAG: hypothetical protein E7451_05490 [Ruminococcaceae bacterium]|nr:hypothetical protein [Oscillospiraceae bacterium]